VRRCAELSLWWWVNLFRLFHPPGLALLAAIGLAGCGERFGEYLPVSSIAPNGFVTDVRTVAKLQGQEVRLWGFVDPGNLYADEDAKRVLGAWWGGAGPDAATWRFGLKAEEDDPVGHSIPVQVRNDAGRDALLGAFRADAEAGRPTRLFLQGRLRTYAAPTQFLSFTGIVLEVPSSQAILLNLNSHGP
jgi:hypothetical protein